MFRQLSLVEIQERARALAQAAEAEVDDSDMDDDAKDDEQLQYPNSDSELAKPAQEDDDDDDPDRALFLSFGRMFFFFLSFFFSSDIVSTEADHDDGLNQVGENDNPAADMDTTGESDVDEMDVDNPSNNVRFFFFVLFYFANDICCRLKLTHPQLR